MSDALSRMCVLLPCSASRLWAVPQCCLGEIVTVPALADQPPDEITWRGEVVPVVDFGCAGDSPWRDQRGGVGLVAIMLGRQDEPCRYWGVAVRGEGLGVSELTENTVEDLPDAVLDYASAAFRLGDIVYQVPDLLAVQRAMVCGGINKREPGGRGAGPLEQE
jgi:hypothetical protein